VRGLIIQPVTVLAEAAALATSPALTDELVSHGELMSTLLFVEILRERDVQAQWFDVRKVMRTNDRFGRAEPDIAALAELAALQLLPRLNEGLVITQGFIGSENKGRTTLPARLSFHPPGRPHPDSSPVALHPVPFHPPLFTSFTTSTT
ncbi:hypothetical protein PV939_11860, partial [Ligilactobacillus salivarius]|nr:hypothetical protein [Ligilactobacillus salivarius]